jgi:hypothetical protein
VKKNPKRKLKLLWELNPNMAYIFWSLNCEKKSKRKLKLLWELNPNIAYIFWSLNCEKKSKMKVKTPLGVEPKHGLYILEFEF